MRDLTDSHFWFSSWYNNVHMIWNKGRDENQETGPNGPVHWIPMIAPFFWRLHDFLIFRLRSAKRWHKPNVSTLLETCSERSSHRTGGNDIKIPRMLVVRPSCPAENNSVPYVSTQQGLQSQEGHVLDHCLWTPPPTHKLNFCDVHIEFLTIVQRGPPPQH